MKTDTQTQLKLCSCGHDKNSEFVIQIEKYTFWGEILHLIGISAKPIKIVYQCIKCQEDFDMTADPKGLKKEL